MVLIFKRNFVQRNIPNFQRFILADDDTWVFKKNLQRSVPYWKKVKEESESEEEENNVAGSTKKKNKRINGEYDKDSPPSKTKK